MAGSHPKQTQDLNVLLSQVIAVRRNSPMEYELKLHRHFQARANQMRKGIFDGMQLPEIKLEPDELKENLQMSQKIVEKAQCNAEQYMYAKEKNQHLNDELKEMAETLQKITEIEKNMRK